MEASVEPLGRVPRGRWIASLAILALCIAAAFVPRAWLWPLDSVGYAVCHRIPERSFFFGYNQLPVCARDTGMFGAALMGILTASVMISGRPGAFPVRFYRVVLLVAFLAWAGDGFNSYILLLRGSPLVYEPRNWLRLVTGAGMGSALSVYVIGLFNQTVWPNPDAHSTLHDWRDLARLGLGAAFIVIIVLARVPELYGPVALFSVLGVIALFVTVNGLTWILVTRQAGRMQHTRQLIVPALIGLALTLLEIGAIDAARAALTRRLGLPY